MLAVVAWMHVFGRNMSKNRFGRRTMQHSGDREVAKNACYIAVMSKPTHLSDQQLIAHLDGLVASERTTCAQVLAHIAEVDDRKLYHYDGFSSMYQYAIGRLNYSEGAARHRITAARLARQWPVVLDMVSNGQLHLTGLGVLAPHLTADNHREVLARAAGKTKREIEELVAALFPRPDVPPTITSLDTEMAQEPPSQPAAAGEHPPAPVARGTEPLSGDSFAVTFTIDKKCRDKLAEAQALLAHQAPNGDLGTVFDRALDALLTTLRKHKFGETNARRRARSTTKPGSRHIPAHVRREVAERDGHRCTFLGATGRRCNEVARLEYHHEAPFARGGPNTADNIRLLCSRHNAHLAERDYGEHHIAAKKIAETAITALHRLGFKQHLARKAVKLAVSDLPPMPTLEGLLRQALRHTARL